MKRLSFGIFAACLAMVGPGTVVSSAQTAPAAAVPAGVTGGVRAPHFYPTVGVRRASPALASTINMTYNGGLVETQPAVFISWWGPEWASGFSTGGYTSAQAKTYTIDFFGGVGATTWENVTAQYCQAVPIGTINCGSSGQHIAHVSRQLKATWNDTTAVPTSPTETDIANAAIRLTQHFGYYANATYFVYTPSGKSMDGFQTSFCAWHSVTNSARGQVAFAYMPYQPDAGWSCGMNFVNPSNNNYGNGYFDGFSIVGGHEYAEAETDTLRSGTAWIDSSGSEIGDKCAWSSSSSDIKAGWHQYAVQPLWSNANTACAMSY